MSKGMICAIPFMQTVCSITATHLQHVRLQGCQVIYLTSILPHTVISSLSTLINQVLFTLMVCAFLLGIHLTQPPQACHKKNDWFLLKQAFISCDAPVPCQNQILRDDSIRWSVMNMIPNWEPSSKMALDFMHNIFLGLIAHFFTQVLFAAHMFPGRGAQHSSKQQFETFINEFQWPSHITRLPKNVRSCFVVHLIFLSKRA